MDVRWGLTAIITAALGCAEPGGWSGEPAPAEVGVPNGDEVTARIGPDGGVLVSEDGAFRLDVPAGALLVETEFTLQPITNTAWGGLGDAYRVSPAQAFEAPVDLTFVYTEDDLLEATEDALGVAAQDADGNWIAFGDGSVGDGLLTVETTDLGSPVPLGRGARGSADFAKHWRFRLEPEETTVKVGGSKRLSLVACTATETLGWPFGLASGVVLGPPAPYTHGGPVGWSVVGVPAGTVRGDGSGATYVAPTTTAASGKTNIVWAEFVVGSRTHRAKSTIRIEGDTTWVGTTLLSGDGYQNLTEVTWTLDETHGSERWFVPTGEVQVTITEPGCTWAPLVWEVVEADGLLVVDESVEPAVYKGHGVTVWVMDVSCPRAPTVSLPWPVPWFGDADDVLTTLGSVTTVDEKRVIEGSVELEDATLSWRFEEQ